MLFRHGWPDSTETQFWPWNQWESHCIHRWPHIWNSHTSGASRHQNTTEVPLEQKLNLHQVGDPIKRHTDLLNYWYIIHNIWWTCHFRSKGQCATEIQLLNTPHDRWRCRKAMTPLWCSSIDTLCTRKKLARALSPLGVAATAILTTKITWWHGNADYDCSRSKL